MNSYVLLSTSICPPFNKKKIPSLNKIIEKIEIFVPNEKGLF